MGVQLNKYLALRGNFTFARASYQFPRSNFGFFAEGTGWIYEWDRNRLNETRFDTTWSGGISYRFGL